MISFEYYVSKFALNSPSNKTAVIRTIWNESQIDFTIVLLNQQVATSTSLEHSCSILEEYFGELPLSELKKNASALEIPYDEFLAETKNIFCNPNENPDFTCECDHGIFRWSKKTTSDVKLVYASINLNKKPNLSVDILLDLLSINADVNKKYDECSAKMQNLKVQLNECETLLNQTIDEKLTTERNLLTKFTDLLNEKKKKISQLEHLIGNLKTHERTNGGLYTKDNSIDQNTNKRSISLDSEGSEDVSKSIDSIAQSKVPKRMKRMTKQKSSIDLPVASTYHSDLSRNAMENQSKASSRTTSDKEDKTPKGSASPTIFDKNTEEIFENMLEQM